MTCGADIQLNSKDAARQAYDLPKLVKWLAHPKFQGRRRPPRRTAGLSGTRDPCAGRLDVVKVDALADLPLIPGDPIGNINPCITSWSSSRMGLRHALQRRDLPWRGLNLVLLPTQRVSR